MRPRSHNYYVALLDEALEPFLKDVVIATKFGFKEGKTALGMDSRPENIKAFTEAALKRLKTDVIDLGCAKRLTGCAKRPRFAKIYYIASGDFFGVISKSQTMAWKSQKYYLCINHGRLIKD